MVEVVPYSVITEKKILSPAIVLRFSDFQYNHSKIVFDGVIKITVVSQANHSIMFFLEVQFNHMQYSL